MSFIDNFESLIETSNKDITNLKSDNGITIYNYDSNFKLLSSKKLLDGSYSFADYWLDISKLDMIYGLVNNKNGTLIHLYITGNFIIKNNILKYNPNKSIIKFPYIKVINGITHIIYFEIHKGSDYCCSLIHYCRNDKGWLKYEIDSINYGILTNFVVIFNEYNPSIFYLKIVNESEELFYSAFDFAARTWSIPVQITNTNREKIYLSVIKSSNNFYNITYSENNLNRYCCTYINGYIKDNKFISGLPITISKTLACVFPNLIEHRNKLYVQWIEHHKLYISISTDFGATWSKETLAESACDFPFSCYSFKSNYFTNDIYNLSNIFAYDKSLEILGVKNFTTDENEHNKSFTLQEIDFSKMKDNPTSNIKIN